MLKGKISALNKKVTQITKAKTNGVYFVELHEGMYTVRTSRSEEPLFHGERDSFNDFTKKYGDSVFIIDDIPKGETGSSIDWAN
jgi:hypothetical protein